MTAELRARLQATLSGSYTLERELGGGGMSRVFLAQENSLDRQVVIKVIAAELTEGLSAERFTREVRLAAKLQQANIVPLLSAGTAGGLPYYTMPYVRGESLRARMAAGPPLSLTESVSILRDVARALAYAHGEGIVHRDIKPDNVLLSHGTAVVTDFGIAKAISAARTEDGGASATLTHAGGSIGTPAYMAPEQALGDVVDHRTDLYAWGVMAYELLTGAHPFAARTTPQQLIGAHLSEAPAAIIGKAASTPPALAAVIMGCLAKEPGQRPDSAAELLAALDGAGTARRAIRARTIGIATAGLLTVAVAGYVLTRPAEPTAQLEPKRVVVATFENKSGDRALDPLGAMAADWIARGLVGTGLVDVGGTAADLAARGVTASAQPGQSAIQALARNANAGLVISGAYYAQGDSVLFQADFTDANAGKLVQTVGPVAARASAPLEGVERLRQQVIGSLGPLVDEGLLTLGSVLSRPPSLEAYREFLAGQELFYRDEAAAVERFARAAAADSNYQIPLLWSLVLLHNIGDGGRADSLIRVLEGRRGRMTPYEQVYLDYAKCRSAPDIATCVPSTAALLRLTPKSQFVKYLHGIMLRWVNRPRAADSVFRGVDPLSGEMRGRIYYVTNHAASLHVLGEYERELAVVREGEVQYPGRLILAFTHVRALVGLGRPAEVHPLIEEALKLPRDLRVSAALTGAMTLYELRWHGYAGAADSLGAQLLAWLDARPAAEAGTERGRHDRAMVLMATRRWRELEAVTDSMARGDPGNVEVMRLRGVALAMQGKRAEAAAIDQGLERDTRPIRPADQCKFYFVCRRAARAYIAAALGDKARAVTLIDVWVFRTDIEAHFDLLGELLKDYAPFQEIAKPGG